MSWGYFTLGEPRVKPATTYEGQLDILRSRGLIIEDEDSALNVLRQINYYRFSAYTLTLKDRKTDVFHKGATFEDVFRLYEFDRKLRHLISGVLEPVEVSFRTHVAFELAHLYGPLGYQKAEYFKREDFHQGTLDELQNSIKKNQEVFIEHHLTKYSGLFPIWVAVELLSFGAISKLFANMRDSDQEKISRNYYHATSGYIESWFRTAVHLRNVCAHYARIYNKFSRVTPKLHARHRGKFNTKSIFAAIFVLRELHPSKESWRSFVTELDALIEEYHDSIDLYKLGFPTNWAELLIYIP